MDMEIEDRNSWSNDFSLLVNSHRDLIINYQKERNRIERLGWEDVILRNYPPENKYKEDYLNLVSLSESTITNHRIIGYHCTRLTIEEIQMILNSGMQILSHELVAMKFRLARDAGYISREQYNTLLEHQEIKESVNNRHGKRSGMIWFCPNRSTLKESDSVYRLFRSWGGEAVYVFHEEGKNAIPILRKIGKPCIVKCAIPIVDIKHYSRYLSERFISFSVANEIEYPEPSPDFDMNVIRNLVSGEVVEIINVDNPKFLELTNYNLWSQFHAIL